MIYRLFSTIIVVGLLVITCRPYSPFEGGLGGCFSHVEILNTSSDPVGFAKSYGSKQYLLPACYQFD